MPTRTRRPARPASPPRAIARPRPRPPRPAPTRWLTHREWLEVGLLAGLCAGMHLAAQLAPYFA